MSAVDAMAAMDVVLVNRDTREHLLDALPTVLAESPRRVVVVDNGSSDGSAAAVRERFPSVEVIARADNPGYGAAANQGIAACPAPFVLLLNSDVLLQPGALGALSSHLQSHPRAGLAGPRLVDPDGRLQPSCAPFLGSFRMIVEKSPLGRLLARVPPVRERWLLRWSSHDRPRVVPWVLGAALAIRREAFEQVGGFDPSFYMYAEEVDLCWRLREAGWETHFAPVATIAHVGGASTAAVREEMERRRVESARRFYRLHYSRGHVLALEALIRAAGALRGGRP
jgi:GT2 family glycosyltransferase